MRAGKLSEFSYCGEGLLNKPTQIYKSNSETQHVVLPLQLCNLLTYIVQFFDSRELARTHRAGAVLCDGSKRSILPLLSDT